jgi:hypothetical protein
MEILTHLPFSNRTFFQLDSSFKKPYIIRVGRREQQNLSPKQIKRKFKNEEDHPCRSHPRFCLLRFRGSRPRNAHVHFPEEGSFPRLCFREGPPQKELEVEKVVSVETPFQRVAWENNRRFNDEFRVVNLGIGF